MTGGGSVRPPWLCRVLVRTASWIVPQQAREEWRARWDSSLWNWWILFERGELTARDRAELIRHSWGSFRDAVWLRITPEHLRHSLRSPRFLLAAAAAALVLLGIASAGFTGTRALLRPLPIADPDSLVTIRYTGSMNQPNGVPPKLVPVWTQHSKLLDGVAGYVRHPYSSHARVTADFFTVLGTPVVLGRTFREGDADAAILSHSVWRGIYGSDPYVIGRNITVEGHEYTVVGVLPERFWAISPAVQVWTPLELWPRMAPDVPFLIGAVGRLKPGSAIVPVRRELLSLGRGVVWPLPRAPEVIEFRAMTERPLFTYVSVALFALVVGLVLPALGRMITLRHGWRYSTLLAVKTLFAVALPLLAWIETGTALSAVLPEGPVRQVLTGFPLTALFILGNALVMLWSFTDQRCRCPVCLYRLAMPVTLGSWASVFDPVTTELLCDSGHGSLSLPETDSGPERWMGMDDSWAGLFQRDR